MSKLSKTGSCGEPTIPNFSWSFSIKIPLEFFISQIQNQMHLLFKFSSSLDSIKFKKFGKSEHNLYTAFLSKLLANCVQNQDRKPSFFLQKTTQNQDRKPSFFRKKNAKKKPKKSAFLFYIIYRFLFGIGLAIQ